MSYVNKNIFLAILIGVLLCYFGYLLANRIKNDKINYLFIVIFSIISLPAFSFIVYYFHFFNPPNWYIEYRSIPRIELLSGLIGGTIGYFSNKYLIGLFKSLKFSIVFSILIISIPFIKPIISPLNGNLPDDWSDNVCLQSCGSTCGPSSLATIFKFYNISKTEQEIAENCYSCASSTEIWYLIRYARENSLIVNCIEIKTLSDAKIPSILGTRLGKTVGHFITLLGRENEYFIIGDPLKGKLKYTENEFNKIYELNNVTYWITDKKNANLQHAITFLTNDSE